LADFLLLDLVVFVLIRMKILSEKRIELSQTVTSLFRMEKGCRRCALRGRCGSTENRFQMEPSIILLKERGE